jgi:hypothetical protein
MKAQQYNRLGSSYYNKLRAEYPSEVSTGSGVLTADKSLHVDPELEKATTLRQRPWTLGFEGVCNVGFQRLCNC